MTIADVLRDAENAVREYAVYLSYDRDAARKRGDPELAGDLSRRHTQAHQLGDELHELNPAVVESDVKELAAVRAIAAELTHRLGMLEPAIRRDELTSGGAKLSLVPTNIAGVDRVVAYLRVSTDRQADRGFGLDVQEAAVREWAKRNKSRIVAVIREEGKSGADSIIDRPGLAEALGHVQSGRAGAVVVPRLDRLSRELVLQEWIRADLLKAGAQLRSADRIEDLHLVGDPDNPTGTLVRQIMGAIAQYERSMIRLRMGAGKERKRAAGGYVGGRPAYGYAAVDGELVPVVDEQKHISRMKRWRREGKSYRDIADKLNQESVPARDGGKWHPLTVSRVLEHRARRKDPA